MLCERLENALTTEYSICTVQYHLTILERPTYSAQRNTDYKCVIPLREHRSLLRRLAEESPSEISKYHPVIFQAL